MKEMKGIICDDKLESDGFILPEILTAAGIDGIDDEGELQIVVSPEDEKIGP